MANTKSNIPFDGTKEQEQELYAAIERLRGERGALMPILQEAQKIYGYLPYEVQKMIAQKLEISMEKVYQVVTFYSQFTLSSRGKYNISVCLGTACYVKGSGEVLEKLEQKLNIKNGECTPDRKFRIEACRCIGACGLAPVMTVNDDVYGKMTPDRIDEILAKYE